MKRRLCCLCLLLLPLAACVSVDRSVENEAQQFSMVSVTSPGFQPQRGAAFAWYAPVVWASEVVSYNEALEKETTGLVEEGIVAKGYRMVDSIAEADYIIGAAIVDGQSEQSSQVRDFFSLYPVLGDGAGDLPHTTAMVGVIEADDYARIGGLNSNELLWRSAIELFVEGDRLAGEVQHARLRRLAVELMRSLPRARAGSID